MADRSFGVDAGLPGATAAELARRVEAAGYSTLWVTDTPKADGLADLAAFAGATTGLFLGIGVIPVDRRPPAAIVARMVELGLPLERVRLGIGSGASRRPLGLVRDAVSALRNMLPGVEIVVAAMGPKMTALGSEVADGVLMNWLTPERVPVFRSHWSPGARSRALMYVRAALDPGGRERIAREAGRYAGWNSAYFAANGVPLEDMGVAGSAEAIRHQLEAYDTVLDEVIVRALPSSQTPEDLYALAAAAAPTISPD